MGLRDLFSEVKDSGPKRSSVFDWLKNPDHREPSEEIKKPRHAFPAFSDDFVFWAMTQIPAREATKHFLACGSAGAGKTTIIDLFTQSIAPRFRKDRSQAQQLIIFDSKGDAIPKLAGLGLRLNDKDSNVWLLNPYDNRSAKWAISEAVKLPVMARHFVALLIPEEKSSNSPYFWKAARLLLRATMKAMSGIKADWDLRDLIEATSSKRRMEAIISRNKVAKRAAKAVLEDTETVHGVASSVVSRIEAFEDVAALWHSAPTGKPFSIKEFLERPGVLIIGYDDVLNESFWPINAMLLRSLAKEILRGPETYDPRHWFVFDEFPALGAIDTIKELVSRGRSKGTSVLVGIQSIDQLYDLYSPSGANILLEQIAFKTFCRAGGPNTAEWAERYFGKYRRREKILTENFGPVRTHSFQHSIAERSVFLASYFMNLPLTGPGKRIVTVNDVPTEGNTVIAERDFDEVSSWRTPADVQGHPPLIPRTEAKDQELKPWNEMEIVGFCGAGFVDDPKEKKKKGKRKWPTRTSHDKPK